MLVQQVFSSSSGPSGGLSSHHSSKGALDNTEWARKLPIPSILEKWHMDAKLQERFNIMEKLQKGNRKDMGIKSSFSSSTATSTVAILQQRRYRLQQGLPLMDPTLLSKQAPSMFIETLRPEVQKCYQQSQTKSNNTPSSTPLLPPSKFNKKAQRIQKGLFRLVCEAMDSFDKQLSQEAQREATRSSTKGSAKRPRIFNQNGDVDAMMVQVTYAGVTLKVHAVYVEKLQRLYDREMHRRYYQNEKEEKLRSPQLQYQGEDNKNHTTIVCCLSKRHCFACCAGTI